MPKSGQLWDSTFFQRSALLSDFARLAAPLLGCGRWPTLSEYTSAVDDQRRTCAPDLEPVSFAAMEPKRRRRGPMVPVEIERSYDGRIALCRQIPCHVASYHDWFNALAWSAFPRAKRVLHARQFRALRARIPQGATRLPNGRSREQDALTLFDEGGCILAHTRDVRAELQRPTGAQRSDGTMVHAGGGLRVPYGQDARLVIFGHALMEHVAFQPATVHSVALLLEFPSPLPSGLDLIEEIDRVLAQRIANSNEFNEPRRSPLVWIQPPESAWIRP